LRWRDSAHNGEQKLMTLSLDEFLRRFLLHRLPKGFVRIRNFGFLANRRRATLLPLCLHLLGSAQEPQVEQDATSINDSSELWRCPNCRQPMKIVERLTAADIQLRSPPGVTAAARIDSLQHEYFACFGTLRPTAPCLRTNCLFRFLQTLCPRHFFAPANFQPLTVLSRAPPHSVGVPSRAPSTPFNSHRARVCRNHGRLPSNGSIERARSTRPPPLFHEDARPIEH
jgi:hypothetical protein